MFRRPDREFPCEPLERDAETDVLVVGGGITGLSAACHLLKAGRRVTLVEAEAFGCQTLGASGGFLTSHVEVDFSASRPERAYALHRFFSSGLDGLRAAVQEHGLQCELEQDCQALYLSYGGRDQRRVEREASVRRRLGMRDDRLLGAAELQELFRNTRFRRALLNGGHHALNPWLLGVELARAIKALGAETHARTTVRRIDPALRTAVMSTGARLRYAAAVLAAGAGTPALLPNPSLLHDRTLKVVSQVLATPPLSPAQFSAVFPSGRSLHLWDTNEFYCYARCTPEQQMLFGGADYFRPPAGNPLPDAKAWMRLRRQFELFFPALKSLSPMHYWQAPIPASIDSCPLLGEAAPNLWIAAFAPGIGPGFAAGRLIAAKLTGSADPQEWELCRWERKLPRRQKLAAHMLSSAAGCAAANRLVRILDALRQY